MQLVCPDNVVQFHDKPIGSSINRYPVSAHCKLYFAAAYLLYFTTSRRHPYAALAWERGAKALSSLERTIFWIFTGACMGIGLIAFGLALLPFFFGATLALYGIKRIGTHGLWITLVSIGLVPTALVAYQYISADRSTTFIPANPLLPLVVGFGPIVLIGLIWGYRERREMRNSQVR